MTPKKTLPDMSQWTDDQIAEFWEAHSAADYEEQLKEIALEPDAPIMDQVTFRLDRQDVDAIKRIAEELGVGHTTLVRMWVKEKLKSENLS